MPGRATEQEIQRIRYAWISTGEAGRRLGGIPSEKVRELIERRKLRALDVNEGGKVPTYLVDPASIDEYLARNLVEPEGEASAAA